MFGIKYLSTLDDIEANGEVNSEAELRERPVPEFDGTESRSDC